MKYIVVFFSITLSAMIANSASAAPDEYTIKFNGCVKNNNQEIECTLLWKVHRMIGDIQSMGSTLLDNQLDSFKLKKRSIFINGRKVVEGSPEYFYENYNNSSLADGPAKGDSVKEVFYFDSKNGKQPYVFKTEMKWMNHPLSFEALRLWPFGSENYEFRIK